MTDDEIKHDRWRLYASHVRNSHRSLPLEHRLMLLVLAIYIVDAEPAPISELVGACALEEPAVRSVLTDLIFWDLLGHRATTDTDGAVLKDFVIDVDLLHRRRPFPERAGSSTYRAKRLAPGKP